MENKPFVFAGKFKDLQNAVDEEIKHRQTEVIEMTTTNGIGKHATKVIINAIDRRLDQLIADGCETINTADDMEEYVDLQKTKYQLLVKDKRSEMTILKEQLDDNRRRIMNTANSYEVADDINELTLNVNGVVYNIPFTADVFVMLDDFLDEYLND